MRYRHVETGNEGVFEKEYTRTGGVRTIMIKMDDGRIYFAPKSEFILIN